jgi:hypothetical protein
VEEEGEAQAIWEVDLGRPIEEEAQEKEIGSEDEGNTDLPMSKVPEIVVELVETEEGEETLALPDEDNFMQDFQDKEAEVRNAHQQPQDENNAVSNDEYAEHEHDPNELMIPYDPDGDDDGDFSDIIELDFLESGWAGECLQDTEDIDFEFVYALHTFVATVEGQANATKGDTMVLLDDSNSYWWLVRVVKDSSIGMWEDSGDWSNTY